METFDHIWTKLGGRKLIAFLITVGIVTALAWTGKMTDTVMWTLLGLFTAYAGGNSLEHWATAIRNKGLPIPSPPSAPEEEDEEDEEDEDEEEEDDNKEA